MGGRGHRLRTPDGFTMIEVLIAMFVLAIGILALAGSFDSARRLTLVSERRTAMAHRAQLELERLQTYPYSELAMISKPSHSTEPTNPDYYVNYTPAAKCTTAEPCLAWNSLATGEEEPLVLATKEVDCATKEESGCGLLAASPTGRDCSKYVGACEWKEGLVEGYAYDFVTWHNDGKCGLKCGEKNYKRLTVIVIAKVPAGNHEPAAVRVSTLIV
jgi:prepilin-type N-terminal cleavage/methylation domain-containing protein